jgi:hypothetical protein
LLSFSTLFFLFFVAQLYFFTYICCPVVAQLLLSKIMMRKEERRDDKGVIVDVNGTMARLLYGGLDGGVILVAMQGRKPSKY